jgi:hypothetical protein
VYSSPAREFFGAGLLLTDESGSTEMAVDGSIGGTPDTAYIDSTTANWSQAAISGTWDFASTGVTPQGGTECIDATGTADGDQMQLEKTSNVSMGSYSAISGYIYLTSYNVSRHDVEIELRLAGVLVGLVANVTDYIDTGLLGAWQRFVIPKEVFGISSEEIDQIVFSTVSTSGQPPNYYLDTINIEETGGILYTFSPPLGQVFDLYSVDFVLRDNVTAIEPEQFMGLAALTNGVRVRTRVDGITRFSAGVKVLADWLAAGSNVKSTMFGATDTAVQIQGLAPGTPIRINGNNGDTYSISIADDLSSLTSFTVIVRGGLLR